MILSQILRLVAFSACVFYVHGLRMELSPRAPGGVNSRYLYILTLYTDSRLLTCNGNVAVIVQMFEWTWDSIASECTKFLGPAGYGFVQGDSFPKLFQIYLSSDFDWAVSPPCEHISGPQWWTDYQPVSYILTSKRGNQEQFSNMINTCHAAGVKVIAGAVVSHNTASLDWWWLMY